MHELCMQKVRETAYVGGRILEVLSEKPEGLPGLPGKWQKSRRGF
jgi:hypothetical protein